MISVLAAVAVVVTIAHVTFAFAVAYFQDHPKKNEEPKFQSTAPEFKCSHTWKDFPWYVESIYHTGVRELHYKIIKPYVCIHCKERANQTLCDRVRIGISREESTTILTDLYAEFSDKIVEKPLVEEMILDMQLVDRKALEIAQQIGIIEENK